MSPSYITCVRVLAPADRIVPAMLVALGLCGIGLSQDAPTKVVTPNQKAQGAQASATKGHAGGITDLAYSADGKKIVSSSDDGKIKIWNSEKGEELFTLSGHRGPVVCVGISPDGKRVVSFGYDDRIIQLWDAETGKKVQALSPESPNGQSIRLEPESFDFSPDGKRLLTTSGTKVAVCDLDENKLVAVLEGHKSTVVSARYSPDGKLIASAARDKTLKLWDAQTAKEIRTFDDNVAWVEGVAFSPDSKKVVGALGTKGNVAKVWDVESGKLLHELVGHGNGVMCVAFSPDGKQIATGGIDRTVRVWDAATGKLSFTIQGYSDTLRGVAFSPDGKRIIAGSGGRGPGIPGDLKIWDTEKGALQLTLSDSANAPARRRRTVVFNPGNGKMPGMVGVRPAPVPSDKEDMVTQPHTGKVWSVAFSPDGAYIVSGGEDQTVKISDAQNGRLMQTIQAHSKTVMSVAYSPDGKKVLSGGAGVTNLSLWDASSGKLVKTYKGHNLEVLSVAFSPDGKRVASGSTDSTIKLWVTAVGNELRTLKGHAGPITGIAFSPDGARLVSSSFDKTAKIWNTNTGKLIATLVGHMGRLGCVAFSPDGTRLVTGSEDKNLKVWDMITGKELFTLRGHTGRVTSVAFSTDGRRIVSGGEAEGLVDKTIKIWDANRGQEIRTITNTPYYIMSVAFSPDGKRLVAACDFLGPPKTGVRVWNVESTAMGSPSPADIVDLPQPKPAPTPPMRKAAPPAPKPVAKTGPIVLIPTAENGRAATWSYTTTDPGDGWALGKFDASRWLTGRAGFCSTGHRTVQRNTLWRSKEIWLRSTIELPKSTANYKYILRVGHDDGLVVYINGTEVYRNEGVSGSPQSGPYVEVVLEGEKAGFLRSRKNIVAAKGTDTGGESAVDIGLTLVPKE